MRLRCSSDSGIAGSAFHPQFGGFAHQQRLCRRIELATAGAVRRESLRPDVFGPAPSPVKGEATHAA